MVLCIFHTQEPTKIKLGAKWMSRGHGRKRRLVQVTDTLVYVPLLKTIETLLKDEGIFTEVFLFFNLLHFYLCVFLRSKMVINVPYPGT